MVSVEQRAESIATARRLFEEVFNEGRLEVADELGAPDLVFHSPTLDEPGHGPESIKEFAGGLRRGFPDLHIEIEQEFEDDGYVIARWRTTSQTHLGPYMGIPPTGRSITMTGIDIFKVRDGRIHEIWIEIDALGGVQQMGVVPPNRVSTPRRIAFVLSSLGRMAYLEARHSMRSRGEKT
jgi:steroid delta-isomerase-like uncharacterized protein